MTNLYEYQAKKLFTKYNLPILKGSVCSNVQDISLYIKNNKGPWAAKCQIQSGGRGKSAGICITNSPEEILYFSKKWFGNKLITYQTTDTGELVNHILIEPAIKNFQELYVSMLIDRNYYQIICMVSAQGGIDIENVNKNNSNAIHKIIIDPIVGALPYQGRILACKLKLFGKQINQFSNIIVNISNMLLERDLMLVEINPLIITDNNSFFCLDAKVIVDKNAMFRQSEFFDIYIKDKKIVSMQSPTKKLNVNYIPLSRGNIGCMVNGAGLAMATMDLIKESGGIPANFLDIGGEANKECIMSALCMLLKNKNIKAILVNIFGGIICCDLIAESIISALSITINDTITTQNHPIIIARLQGNNATLGLKKLIDSKFNIITTDNLKNAIQQVITAVK